MKAKSLLFALFGLVAIAACDPTTVPEDSVKFSVSGAKDNAITVDAAGATVKISVTSNVSWTILEDADWLSVDPASVEITEGKEVTTKVSVVVDPYDAVDVSRTTTLKVEVLGAEPVVITVEQKPAEAQADYFHFFDAAEFEAIENVEVECSWKGNASEVYVKSNLNWVVSEAPEWVELSLRESVYDPENDIVALGVSASKNMDSPREGKVVLKASNDTQIEFAVKQGASKTFSFSTVEVEHSYCDHSVKVIPEDKSIAWDLVYIDTPTFKEKNYSVEFLGAYILEQKNKYLEKNTPEKILNSACKTGEDQLDFVVELDPSTEYIAVVVGIEYNESSRAFEEATLPVQYTFSTTAAPEIDPAYAAVVGMYTVKLYDYFASKKAGEPVFVDVPLYFDQKYINESYFLAFLDPSMTPGMNYYSQYGLQFVDWFDAAWDNDKKEVLLGESYGSMGYFWGLDGEDDNFAVKLTPNWWESADAVLPFHFAKDESGNLALVDEVPVLTDAESGEEYNDVLELSVKWVGETVGDVGYQFAGFAMSYGFDLYTESEETVAKASVKAKGIREKSKTPKMQCKFEPLKK